MDQKSSTDPQPDPEAPGAALTVIRAPGVNFLLPPTIAAAGEAAARATLEFFLARIPNPNTREAYGRAVKRFCDWCQKHELGLVDVTSPDIALYLEELGAGLSVPSTKLHLAGVRHWMDWLVRRGVIAVNPAAAVRGQKHIVREGKTPVLERDQGRQLFAAISGEDVVSLRDKALLAVMLFGFVRVGAVTKMRVCDFLDEGKDAELRVREKGGQHRVIPCHHITREFLRDYLRAAGLDPASKAPLFQSAPRRSQQVSSKPLSRGNVLAMVKRRCMAAGLPSSICNHSFRATGITMHQEAGGRLEDAQLLAGHASPRTTQLYIRKLRKIARAEVERVQL